MKTTKEQRYGLSLLCAIKTEKAKGVYPALADTCKFMLDILADIETLEQRIAVAQSQSDRNGIDYMHEREAHDTTKIELAALKSFSSKNSAEMRDLLEEFYRVKLERDRWKAVHDREWDVEVDPSGECSIFDPKEKSGSYHIVDSAPTIEAALDSAFALFPLEAGL